MVIPVLFAFWAAVPVPSAAPLVVEIDRPLTVKEVWDVRWSSAKDLYLALGRGGVVELPLLPETARPEVVIPPNLPGERYGFTGLVALSPERLLFASQVFQFGWKVRGAPAALRTGWQEFIAGIDVHGDRAVFLGAERSDDGEFSPDGAIAWTARLGPEKLEERKPLLIGKAGPGAADLNSCACLEKGGVLFFPDGSLFLLPGVESGAYLYDAEGRTLRTWDTGKLGYTDGCPLSAGEGPAINGDMTVRLRWYNSHRVVDEVLALPTGPGIVVREWKEGMVRWDLVALLPEGKHEQETLPFYSSSDETFLAGDAQGDRLAFVLNDSPPPRRARKQPPRLVVVKLPAN
jgi:hypothetical protein